MKAGTQAVSRRRARFLLTGKRCGVLVLLLLLAGCSASPSVFNPAGPASRQISILGWTMIILGSVIFFIVVAYLLYALFRRRTGPAVFSGMRVVVWGGIIIPALILIGLFVFNINVLGAVNPNLIQTTLTVEVIGHQWWWEVRYPEQGFVTANEVRIPAGQAVRLELTSEDVIHSFWVPELHGKMDLIPGQVQDFWIQADEPGQFRGECAEYCGAQHAKMHLMVIAEPQEQYDQWLAAQQQPASVPDSESAQRGLEIFLTTTCIQCHAIRGTEATGELGPDLTHLASRRTIGAGVLPLNRANLGGWVANPHGIKPAVLMPPANISGEELQALLDFLMTRE